MRSAGRVTARGERIAMDAVGMKRTIDILGAATGGVVGWYAGAELSVWAALLLCVVGAATGLWLAKDWVSKNL